MSPEEKNNPYAQLEKKELQQGDILRGIKFQYVSTKKTGDADINLAFPFPYAVVLSQSCDLEQHYQSLKNKEQASEDAVKSDDKILNTILVCPAFPSEAFLEGKHIEGRNMSNFDNPKGREKIRVKLLSNDSLNRFHYLKSIDNVLPDLVIDFKNFHTVPIDIIKETYEETYLVSLKELYRERLSQRFTNYLSRIGLPGDSNL